MSAVALHGRRSVALHGRNNLPPCFATLRIRQIHTLGQPSKQNYRCFGYESCAAALVMDAPAIDMPIIYQAEDDTDSRDRRPVRSAAACVAVQ